MLSDRPLDTPALFDAQQPFEEPPYSSYADATHGPEPVPDWVVTDHNALDSELGVLKTGKEADVHLMLRGLPDGPECLLAAKRYRSNEHRMFHRDAGYQEGRRTKRSRDTRAMANRTTYGRDLLSGQWAAAEFDALTRMWLAGVPVPYPVQLRGSELLLEFIGDDDGAAAPRLAQCRPSGPELADLFTQCVDAMTLLAREGYAHGDLSAFNILVHHDPLAPQASLAGRLVLIDLPQIVDLVMNPQGADFLERDCRNVCAWFTSRGLETPEYDHLFGDLMAEAVAGW